MTTQNVIRTKNELLRTWLRNIVTHLVPTGWSLLRIMWTFTQVKVNLSPSCQADFIFSITVCGQPYEIHDEKGTLSQIMLRFGASPSRLYLLQWQCNLFSSLSLRAIQSFQQILYCEPNFIRASDVHFRIGLIKKNNEDYETATKVSCSCRSSIRTINQ